MKAYYIARNGGSFGPYAKDQLLSMWRTGQVMPSDQACLNGEDDWVPVESLVGWWLQSDAPKPKQQKRAKKTGKRKDTAGGILVFLIGLACGAAGLFVNILLLPVGIVLVLVGLFSQTTVWKCANCGSGTVKSAKECAGCGASFQ